MAASLPNWGSGKFSLENIYPIAHSHSQMPSLVKHRWREPGGSSCPRNLQPASMQEVLLDQMSMEMGLLSKQRFVSVTNIAKRSHYSCLRQPQYNPAETVPEQLSEGNDDAALGNLLRGTWSPSWCKTILNYLKGHARYFLIMKQHSKNYKMYCREEDRGGVWLIFFPFNFRSLYLDEKQGQKSAHEAFA